MHYFLLKCRMGSRCSNCQKQFRRLYGGLYCEDCMESFLDLGKATRLQAMDGIPPLSAGKVVMMKKRRRELQAMQLSEELAAMGCRAKACPKKRRIPDAADVNRGLQDQQDNFKESVPKGEKPKDELTDPGKMVEKASCLSEEGSPKHLYQYDEPPKKSSHQKGEVFQDGRRITCYKGRFLVTTSKWQNSHRQWRRPLPKPMNQRRGDSIIDTFWFPPYPNCDGSVSGAAGKNISTRISKSHGKQHAARTEHQKPGLCVAPEVVHGKADPVATLPRCSVGQDGPLPVDQIGRMTLGSGMQGLYIAHSDTDCQDLWTSALDIGHSKPLHNLVYFDSEKEKENVLCASVRSALSTTGNQFARHYFMCTKVGDVVAVGFGWNQKKRTRATRIAAAVCVELQAKTPVQEFIWYSELQRLIKQVRSCLSCGRPCSLASS